MRAERVVLVLAFLISGCEHRQTASPPAAAATPTPAPHVVTLPDGFPVAVEVVANDELRAQGLMYRDSVPSGTGMLFVYSQPGEFSFWMKNTMVPLDIIWMAPDGAVVALHENVPPCRFDPCPSYPPGALAQYVLELAGGEAAKHGVIPGARLRLPDLTGVSVQ